MLQQSPPIVIRLADQASDKVIQQANPVATAASILIDSLGLAGVILLAATVAGLLLGGLFILFKHARRGADDRDLVEHARLNLSSLTD